MFGNEMIAMQTVKKIVAREGLIVIGIILFSWVLVALLNNYADYVDTDFKERVKKLGLDNRKVDELTNKELMSALGFRQNEIDTVLQVDQIKMQYPEDSQLTNREFVDKHINSLPAIKELWPQIKKIRRKEKLLEVSSWSEKVARKTANFIEMYVLMFGYPIYLLTRFVIWAIKTLKADSATP